MNIHGGRHIKMKTEWKNKKMILKTEFQAKGSVTARPEIESKNMEKTLAG